MSARIILVVAALLGASGVGLGAYRAHGLETRLRAAALSESDLQKRLDNCETAVRYQMVHALALLAVGSLARVRPNRWWIAPAVCFVVGALLFCGPLYLSALASVQLHWAVIPIGGGLLIAGWCLLAVASCL